MAVEITRGEFLEMFEEVVAQAKQLEDSAA